jgi:N-acetylmuramoyl-L-alanine amidase
MVKSIMVKLNIKKWTSLSILTLFSLGNYLIKPTFAADFTNRELQQNNVIAIAQASARGNYSLIIIEQLSNQRPCWQEQGSNPIQVQPLLLDFDFTGICGRSTDSNGYSIRTGGEDLGWQYRLQIIPQGNNLKLVAVPSRNSTLTPIEIGQSNGISNDFSKIVLNPGWRFTKRVYNGQTLGHIYLTNDDNINTLIANSNPSSTLRAYSNTSNPSNISNTSRNVNNNNSSNNSSNNSNSNPPPTITVDTNNNSDDWIEFSSSTSNSQSNPNSNSNERSIPDFSSNPNNLPVVPVPQPPPLSANRGGTPPSPTPLAATLGYNYRVIVYTRNATEENRVKAIVPDAFRTRINNQVVLQAGLFVEQEKADSLQQQLSQQGLNARVISVN